MQTTLHSYHINLQHTSHISPTNTPTHQPPPNSHIPTKTKKQIASHSSNSSNGSQRPTAESTALFPHFSSSPSLHRSSLHLTSSLLPHSLPNSTHSPPHRTLGTAFSLPPAGPTPPFPRFHSNLRPTNRRASDRPPARSADRNSRGRTPSRTVSLRSTVSTVLPRKNRS